MHAARPAVGRLRPLAAKRLQSLPAASPHPPFPLPTPLSPGVAGRGYADLFLVRTGIGVAHSPGQLQPLQQQRVQVRPPVSGAIWETRV